MCYLSSWLQQDCVKFQWVGSISLVFISALEFLLSILPGSVHFWLVFCCSVCRRVDDFQQRDLTSLLPENSDPRCPRTAEIALSSQFTASK